MEIYFTKHFRERQAERADWIFDTVSIEDSLSHDERLSWKLTNKGVWYEQPADDGSRKYICVLNNLEVYCGVVNKDDNMIIATTYPYTQALRRKFVPLKRFTFPKD